MVDSRGRDGWLKAALQQYYLMRPSLALMALAAQEIDEHDDSHNEYRQWLLEHHPEEADHHEWFYSDLLAMGFTAEDIRKTPPHPALERMIGQQFAAVTMRSPLAALGYFFAIEAFPSDGEAVAKLARRLGVADDALPTMLFHTEADLEHRIPILALIDHYGADAVTYRLIQESAEAMFLGWSAFFRAEASALAA